MGVDYYAHSAVGIKANGYIKEKRVEKRYPKRFYDEESGDEIEIYNRHGELIYETMEKDIYTFANKEFDALWEIGDYLDEFGLTLFLYMDYIDSDSIIGVDISEREGLSEEDMHQKFIEVSLLLANLNLGVEKPRLHTILHISV